MLCRLSISIIYGLAKSTRLVRDDPILWFSMMLMPQGPPALVISGLAELAKVSDLEKMAVAKTLTVSFLGVFVPVITNWCDDRLCTHCRRSYALVLLER